MEQKGGGRAFTTTQTMFASVLILLSVLASTVICRPSGDDGSSSSSSSNYLMGQHNNQQQHYDTHHHYSQQRLPHHQHHNPHHHHSKHGHGHVQPEKLEEEEENRQHQPHHPEPDVDESNKISQFHTPSGSSSGRSQTKRFTPQHRQLPLPSLTSTSSRLTQSKPKSIKSKSNFPTPRRLPAEEEYDYEDGEEEEDEEDSGPTGRHAYLMTTDKKKNSKEKMSEDEALSQAFEKHMRPSSQVGKGGNKEEFHDVYAYQLPSDLWFVVRYNKNADGQVEKYMNIVDSFTNYLDKLDKDVKTVSVNVKGVETVFRLTTKHNNNSNS